MADHDIHERLIARLEETRKALKLVNSAYNGSRIDSLADMAIDNVQRKCPQCNDQGTKQIVGGSTFICSCNRPAYLAECEWRLFIDFLLGTITLTPFAFSTISDEQAYSIRTGRK